MKNLLKVSELHQRISRKGLLEETKNRGTRKETRQAVGLYWHKRKAINSYPKF